MLIHCITLNHSFQQIQQIISNMFPKSTSYYRIEVILMYEELFPIRLTKLRIQKGVSARDMSLSIGQNAGYINNIESGKALPSMSGFFYICEYLNIQPKDFWDDTTNNPSEISKLIEKIKKLDPDTLHALSILIDRLIDAKV